MASTTRLALSASDSPRLAGGAGAEPLVPGRRHATDADSAATMYAFRLVPSRSEARNSSACRLRGMRTSSLPLCAAAAPGGGTSRPAVRASRTHRSTASPMPAAALSGVGPCAWQPGAPRRSRSSPGRRRSRREPERSGRHPRDAARVRPLPALASLRESTPPRPAGQPGRGPANALRRNRRAVAPRVESTRWADSAW